MLQNVTTVNCSECLRSYGTAEIAVEVGEAGWLLPSPLGQELGKAKWTVTL